MDNMTTEEQISAIQTERDDARQDLRDTLTDFNEKVGQVEDEMRPDHVIESHAVGASLIAGAMGFLFGSIVNSQISYALTNRRNRPTVTKYLSIEYDETVVK